MYMFVELSRGKKIEFSHFLWGIITKIYKYDKIVFSQLLEGDFLKNKKNIGKFFERTKSMSGGLRSH